MLVERSAQLSNQVLQFDGILRGNGLVDEDLDAVLEATLRHGRATQILPAARVASTTVNTVPIHLPRPQSLRRLRPVAPSPRYDRLGKGYSAAREGHDFSRAAPPYAQRGFSR
jgi:hypothetical protein